MVRNFKGQVKISDVQAEFDALVTSINEAIDAYNSSEYIKDIDYNDASSDIAPIGYTLSIGALKTILNMYQGQVIGCKVFEDVSDGNNLIVTNGIYFTDRGGIQLPTKVITKGKDYLFWNTSTNNYELGDSSTPSENQIFITNINTNRDIPLYNTMTFDNGITENYKIACQNLMTSREINMVPDTSEKAKFVSGNEADMHQGQGRAETYFKGQLVAYNQQTGSRNCSYYVNNNHLLLPKGVANPYTHNKGSNDKVFEVIINSGSENEEAE